MARHRRSGLAGSPEHHKSAAKKEFKRVLRETGAIPALLQNGFCMGAVRRLTEAATVFGSGLAHAKEAGARRERVASGARVAVTEAEKMVVRTCMGSGAPRMIMAGMRRSKRSR